tara:strand:- start:345 stop:572 length:228 start_codon:yes stop_codon:yes gene_type:complete
MKWDDAYDNISLVDKESAGLPNKHYQLDIFQRHLFEQMSSYYESKDVDRDEIVEKLNELKDVLEELIYEFTKSKS